MQKEYIEEFLNGDLVFRLNGDESLLDLLQEAVESRVEDDGGLMHDLLSAKSVGRYACANSEENACISWDKSSNLFGWCQESWYIGCGYKIIPIEEAFSDELSSNTEEWMKLL